MQNVTDTPLLSPKETFPATVAEVIDNFKLVINRGSINGLIKGERMLVYGLSNEEIIDPDTVEPLGYLELVRGTGKIIFIQDRISILESDNLPSSHRILQGIYDYIDARLKIPSPAEYLSELHENIIARDSFRDKVIKNVVNELITNLSPLSFENPQVGDKVKPI
jgi:hypothetical protein